MNECPSVSIIMPCYNSGSRLYQSVGSIAAQSFKNYELILIDDGSDNDTQKIIGELAASYSFLRTYRQENLGAAAARNKGIKEAKGQYIAFLDSDDTWDPKFLEMMVDALERHPEAVLAYCGWQNLGLEGGRGKPFVPPDYETQDKEAILLENCRWPIHAALTRAEVVRNIGGFDESLSSCMDYDLWLRLAPFSKIIRVPQVLAYYHHHEGEHITNNRLRIAQNHYRVQRKYIDTHPDVLKRLGKRRVRELTLGELRRRAFHALWHGDPQTAQSLFRTLLLSGYFSIQDLKYLLAALLPASWFIPLVKRRTGV